MFNLDGLVCQIPDKQRFTVYNVTLTFYAEHITCQDLIPRVLLNRPRVAWHICIIAGCAGCHR